MTTEVLDRAAAVRRALRDLVAERGFHGTSMSAVAERAGVAAGTAYVHYESKDALVFATYLEVKSELGAAVLEGYDPGALPVDRYRHIARATYAHMREVPERARFLTQLEGSPYHSQAHELLLEQGDRLAEEAARPDLVALLAPLPEGVVWALSLGPILRLAAADDRLSDDEIDRVVEATWRAITLP